MDISSIIEIGSKMAKYGGEVKQGFTDGCHFSKNLSHSDLANFKQELLDSMSNMKTSDFTQAFDKHFAEQLGDNHGCSPMSRLPGADDLTAVKDDIIGSVTDPAEAIDPEKIQQAIKCVDKMGEHMLRRIIGVQVVVLVGLAAVTYWSKEELKDSKKDFESITERCDTLLEDINLLATDMDRFNRGNGDGFNAASVLSRIDALEKRRQRIGSDIVTAKRRAQRNAVVTGFFAGSGLLFGGWSLWNVWSASTTATAVTVGISGALGLATVGVSGYLGFMTIEFIKEIGKIENLQEQLTKANDNIVVIRKNIRKMQQLQQNVLQRNI